MTDDFKEYYVYNMFEENLEHYIDREEGEYDSYLSNYVINEEKNLNKIEGENNIEIQRTRFTLNEKEKSTINKEYQNDNLINLNEKNNNILEYEQEKEIKSYKKALGRKRNYSNEIGKHNKYSEDNILRKIKSSILSYLFNFINSTIFNLYEGNIRKGISKKELKKINQSQIVDAKSNQEFLVKSLKDIFSDDISTKYSFYSADYNKKLIKELLNENDYEKRIKFKKLFSLTFLDCLMHIRGNKYFTELEGIESFEKYTSKFKDDKEYLYLFNYYISHFEEIIIRKKRRKRRKQK